MSISISGRKYDVILDLARRGSRISTCGWGGAELRPEGPSYESGGEFSHHLGGLEECRQVAKSLTIGYFKHS